VNAILSKYERGVEAIDAARMMEMNRQALKMRKALEIRKRKMREMESIKKKE